MPTPFIAGADIRAKFVSFFEDKGHTAVRSSSLVPSDPTLMFVNAGMVQFKDVFTGAEKRPYNRAVSVQKCLRVSGKHNDLEEVGRTPRHHTLFEMLGNFSFGDYFKEDAIAMAWELVVGRWQLPVDKLWVTIHTTDDQAHEIWTRKVGVPAERVVRLGDKDNFWSMGDVGPCGPCTEIHYDLGPSMGPAHPQGPGGGGNRYMEFWNNVFMQFERHPDGSMDPLPRPSVDTGMGLERIAAIVQGQTSNYDTDLIRDLMQDAAQISGLKLGGDPELDTAMRVMADHSRACAFLVADGIIPANEGRGYVLRRIARRGIRFGVKAGLGSESFFHKLTDQVVARMGAAYPELGERRSFIDQVIQREEESFAETRDKGMALLDTALNAGHNQLAGDVVFKLHDTYGFPPDLTRLIAGERGITIDEAGYAEHMEAQRAMGRAAWKGTGDSGGGGVVQALANQGIETTFSGYAHTTGESEVLAIIRDGALVDRLGTGESGEVVVEGTPFYAESGGQQGDTGSMATADTVLTVTDTQRPAGDVVVHHVHVMEGTLNMGDTVGLRVAADRRDASKRNHTATHLLNAALRQVLGDHVSQKGSLVGPNRLRFDFSHFQPLTADELTAVEDLVYAEILRNTPVGTELMELDAARAAGAMAMFGEKYSDEVRVVTVGDFSMELCGGTHVSRAGDIGLFRIVSEAGVSSGVRRIEAQTGHGALQVVRDQAHVVQELSGSLKAQAGDLPEAVARLQADNKALRKEIEAAKRAAALAAADDLLGSAVEVDGFKIIAAQVEGDRNAMREQADKLRDQLGSGVVVLGGVQGDKVAFLAAVSKDLAGKRVHAGKLVGAVAALAGGRGGGRPDFAQAGGTEPGKVGEALAAVVGIVGG